MIKESHIIQDSCISCGKKFNWDEVIIGKMPENVWFHLDCSEKYPDEIEYDGIYNAWFTIEYRPGIKFEFTNE